MAESFQPRFADLVRVSTITQGTGPFVPGEPVNGYRSFSTSLQPGDRFYYCAVHLGRPSEREIGRGTLNADGTIAREPVEGPLTDFSSGVKSLALVAAGEWFQKTLDDLASNAAAAAGAQSAAESAQAAATEARAVADASAPVVASFSAIATMAVPSHLHSFVTQLNGRSALFIRDPDQTQYTAVGQALINSGTMTVAQVSSILGRIRGRDAANVYWVLDCSSQRVHVEHFGATPSGGGDDTAAIQAALDYAYHWGIAAVHAGPGTFGITATIAVPSRVQFAGSGFATQLVFSGTAGPQVLSVLGKSDVTISNMRLLPQTAGLNRTGIFADQCQRLTIRDVWVMGHTDAGGVWLIDCDDCTVDNLYFDGGPARRGYAAYFAGCKRCRVVNSTAYRPDFGFVIVGQDIQPMSDRISAEAFGNTIINCHVSNHDGHAFDINSAWGNIVSGCSAEDYAGTSYHVAYQVKHSTGDNAENNVFIGCTAKDCPSGFGMQQGQGTSFIGCTAFNVTRYGFLLNDSDHTQFIGCKAKEFGLAGIWVNSSCRGTIANGVELETSTATAIGIQLANGGGSITFSFFDNILMYGTMAAAVDIASVASGTRFGNNIYLGGNSIVDASTSTVWAERYNSITNVPTDTFLGRDSAGTGNAEAMSVATAKSLLNLSGTNSGDQTITLTGDVTGSGTGTFAATIGSGAVTYGKIQNVGAESRLLGRGGGVGAGSVQELTLGPRLSLNGTTLNISSQWPETTLASDFTNATAAFSTVTDGTNSLSYTPAANSYFEIQAVLLIQSTSATNLPRIGVSIGAQGTGAYGSVQIEHVGATANSRVTADGSFGTTAANVQVPPGDLPAANTPYMCFVKVRGRSGGTPAPIALQMACETAAANTCFVKAGSQMRAKAS